MEFEVGDEVIYVNESMTDCHPLEAGKSYIITDMFLTLNESEFIRVKQKENDDTYAICYMSSHRDFIKYFEASNFIHEKDWIKRMRYGL